jgi:4-amino-4-deoxy-L-arabinose transferase-like glycosyltransferase
MLYGLRFKRPKSTHLMSKKYVIILFSFLLLLVYFPVFLHLDYLPFRLWDESILGNNALEMRQNHNYIVTYFGGVPEMSNTKPPFMIWCIVLCSNILGFSELSLRLPSAIAALSLCIFLFFALRKYSGSALFGFIAVCVLITCRGYICLHVTRTGEYDSMLVLFSTLASIFLFFATETLNKNVQSKYLCLFFIMLTLALLTKGVACLMMAPGLFTWVLLRQKVFSFLKSPGFYTGLGFFIVFGIGYYLLRESINPGYITAVWNNELGGRFGSVNEGHEGPFSFYFAEIITWQFVNYYLLFPLAAIAGLFFSKTRIKRLVQFSLVVCLPFLFIVSAAATKLPHYDVQAFPYLAIIIASLFYGIYTGIKSFLVMWWPAFPAKVAAFIVVLLLLAKPYSDMMATVYFPIGSLWEEGFSNSCKFFQAVERGKESLPVNKLLSDTSQLQYGPASVLHCYEVELAEHGKNLHVVSPLQLNNADTVMIINNLGWREKLEQRYRVSTIRRIDRYDIDCVVVSIKD